jgi:hypothetical protein
MKLTTLEYQSTESDHFKASSTILRICELFVRMTYNDFEEASSSHLNSCDDNSTDSPSRAILTYVDLFTRSAKQHGANLLGDSSKHVTQELAVRALFA